MRARVFRLVTLLVIGATIGALIGLVISGDWIYTIVFAVGLPVSILAGMIAGSTRAGAPRLTAGRLPGIRTAAPEPPAQAVLNPEPTAVPSTGTMLNGTSLTGEQVTAVTPPPPPRNHRRALRVTTVLVILLGMAIALIPSYRLIGWTAGNLVQGRLFDGNDMRTGLHQQEAIDDIAGVVGSYDFVSVGFYDSYVIVEAPTFVGATTTDTYLWRYGRAFRDGPNSGDIEGLFDASAVDFSLVGRLVAAAMDDTGWTGFTGFYPAVRSFEGEVEISVSLSTDYYTANYTYSAEGELLDRYGTGLD